jgi:hypothetical protein
MPVTTVHPHYALFSPLWQTTRDVTDGEFVIKQKGETYLHKLTGMDYDDYDDYLDGARFYNATGRTIQGLLGMAFRVSPQIEVPRAMQDWLEDITLSGVTIEDFLKKDVEDKLQTGRYGIRIDMREGGSRPYLAEYSAENITYWREDVVDGKRVPTMVVLKEVEFERGEDEFEVEKKDVYHVLDLDESGFCRLRIFRQVGTSNEWLPTEEEPPNRNGERLRFIPFVFDGGVDCTKPPLTDLVSANLGHYKVTADYYDAIKFTSKPQPWIAGLSQTEDKFRIGSRYAWTLPMGATTGYLEYSGAGIADIRQALIDDEARMARLGASVIEEPKEGVEAAETARINQSGKVSLLSTITSTTGQAMTKALRMMAWWGRMTDDLEDPNIVCAMNQDFIEARMSPQDLVSLVQAWQAQGISRDTYLYNVQRGGLLPEGRTIDQEKALIDAEPPPMPQGPGENLDEEEEATDTQEAA